MMDTQTEARRSPATARAGPRVPAAALFGLILLAAGWTVLSSLHGAPRDPASDDGYYLRFMSAVSQRGLGAIPDLFQEWNAAARNWIYPSPLRVGFIAVSALWAHAFGATLDSLARLSAASHLLLVLVTWLCSRRHFGETRALGAAALTAFSPLLLGLSRFALADSFTVLCMSLAVWLFLDFALEPSNRLRLAAFAAAFSAAILVKEMAVLLAIPFAAFAVLDALLRRRPGDLVPHAAALLLAALLATLVLVLAAGGVSPVVETARRILDSPRTNPYAVRYGSGPWFRYVLDFLCLSPGPTLLAIGACGVILLRTGWSEARRREVFLVLVSVGLILGLSFLTKNVRYAAVLEVTQRVLAASLLAVLCGPERARGAVLYGLAVLLLCGLDWWTFRDLWVARGLYDPVSAALLAVRGFVPML